MTTRNVSQATKKRVAAEQKWRCNHCQEILDATFECDHIVPLHRNGSNARWNLQVLCVGCHARKTYYENLHVEEEPPNIRVCLRCNIRYSPHFNHLCEMC